MLGFMHEFCIILIVNMTYTRSQNHTNMVVGEHGIQTNQSCNCCVIAFDVVISCFCPRKCTSLIILDKWFVQIYLNVSLKLFGLQPTNRELELLTIPSDLHTIA